MNEPHTTDQQTWRDDEQVREWARLGMGHAMYEAVAADRRILQTRIEALNFTRVTTSDMQSESWMAGITEALDAVLAALREVER